MTLDRYTDPEAQSIWSEQHAIDLWTQIELAHLSVLLHRPVEATGDVTESMVRAGENLVGHDVGSFLAVLETRLDPEAQRWLHFGLTSSDVVDSANAMRMNETTRLLHRHFQHLQRVIEHREELGLVVNGRTHGQIASPTTIRRRWEAISAAVDGRPPVLPMMLTGAVGGSACQWLGGHSGAVAARFSMRAETRTTQVLPRPYFVRALRYWVDWMTVCEQIALDVRLMSAFGDVSEPERLVGSSTMPGKTNPIKAESISGLVRVARSLLHTAEDGQALWLDRDLSHSSVDRIVFGDVANLAAFVLRRTIHLVSMLRVHPTPIEAPRAAAEVILADIVRTTDQPRSASYKQARVQLGGLIAETPDAETPTADPSKSASRKVLQ